MTETEDEKELFYKTDNTIKLFYNIIKLFYKTDNTKPMLTNLTILTPEELS